MTDYTIYALKTDNDEDEMWKPRLYKSIKQGVGRFGWSWYPGADLRKLRRKLDSKGEDAFSDDDWDVWRAKFLLDVAPGDWLVYINLPEWGRCTVAQATAKYRYDGEWKDFNHQIPVDPKSVRDFDRNDAVVPPSLSRRLKLQGRYWTIGVLDEFEELLGALRGGKAGRQRTRADSRERLSAKIGPLLDGVAERIHKTHPAKHLEQLVAESLENVPGLRNVKVMQGRADIGADVVFDFDAGIPEVGLSVPGRCAVQVKSYSGVMGYARAVEDIRNAFTRDPSFTCGLIISTALEMTEEFEAELEELKSDTGRSVGTLIGRSAAQFFVTFAGIVDA